MFLPDANVLIHALREGSPEHEPCRRWLTATASAGEAIFLCELVEVALLRIPTLPRLRLVPMPEVLGFWQDDLWGYPGIRRITAGHRHGAIFSNYVTALDLCGNDVNDAWLAALAVEHRATLVTTDSGFGRFPRLSWMSLLPS